MRKIDIIVPHERLIEINEIIHKHKVGGMTFYNINGRGRSTTSELEKGYEFRRKFPKIRFRYNNVGRKIGRTQDVCGGDGAG